MDKLKILNRLKELYSSGENLINHLKNINDTPQNNLEDILISYDFQAGSYTKFEVENKEIKKPYYQAIAKTINQLGENNSLLEVGVGEGTTLGNVIHYMNYKPQKLFGFDISWSRVKYAEKFLALMNIENVFLSTGDLFSTPYKSDSIDIVYTSHSIEPNGGRESDALKELYRITRNYLVLLEPAYEFADEEGKIRIEKHGYIKNLYLTAKNLNYDILEYRLFDVSINPLNPTALIIIRKNASTSSVEDPLACPITHSTLKKQGNAFYSNDSLLAYPILDGIPCLLPSNAIIATHFLDFI